jgi:hypothetical protein
MAAGIATFAALLTFQDMFNLETRQEAAVEQQLCPCSENYLVKVESDSSYYTPSNNSSCGTVNCQKGSEDKDCLVHRKTDYRHKLMKKEHQTNAP